MRMRLEKDSLGTKEVPEEAYYGVQTLRALENFPITGIRVHKELVLALAEVKKAAANANMHTKMLSDTLGKAIVTAADEVIEGKISDQFIVDSIQGGAGTSIIMNMNKVLANRALVIIVEDTILFRDFCPYLYRNIFEFTYFSRSSICFIYFLFDSNNLHFIICYFFYIFIRNSFVYHNVMLLCIIKLLLVVP